MTVLPLDVWLIVFDFVPDHNTLWSGVRNVSQHLRACVDDYFLHDVLPECLINLSYSTMHCRPGPSFNYVHLPMRFSRLSDDQTRAIFRQHVFAVPEAHMMIGTVRGWVPFIERYCREMRKATPKVSHRSKSDSLPPLWKRDYSRIYKKLKGKPAWRDGSPLWSYLDTLRSHTSIGRGDRPPYFIKLGGDVHDTELVDLEIDCSSREVSIDWRRTLSAFFVERNFIVLADQKCEPARDYDKALTEVVGDVQSINYNTRWANYDDVDNWCRARRKRLQVWVAANKHRMSTENRLMVEDFVRLARCHMFSYQFEKENIVTMRDRDIETQEVVPERCANDHKALLRWPAGRRNQWAIEKEHRQRAKARRRRGCRGCVVL
ncbi:hypothetical protein FB567DRAFT_591612 [Paraphoma chrysanthemicola]|uniref:Uncharacterized protein n=1 Tax=Paraphoma chrysanthemicola TaxID=798071 RepID=A0A8K0W021_9PLEO|nr:hypothetical protein FB567DRAFT_591612 [Paraphoma chrysanthemicola]